MKTDPHKLAAWITDAMPPSLIPYLDPGRPDQTLHQTIIDILRICFL